MIYLDGDFDNQLFLREVFITVWKLDPQIAPVIDDIAEIAITAHSVAGNHQ